MQYSLFPRLYLFIQRHTALFSYCLHLSNPNDGLATIASGSLAAEASKQDKSKSRVDWPPYDQTHRKYLSLGKFVFYFFFFLFSHFFLWDTGGVIHLGTVYKIHQLLLEYIVVLCVLRFPDLVCSKCLGNSGASNKPAVYLILEAFRLFALDTSRSDRNIVSGNNLDVPFATSFYSRDCP